MQAIAEFAMRTRWHAIGMSMVAAILPLLGWLSTVIVALVCLRHGVMAGSVVLLWTLIPLGVAFYFVGDPSPVLASGGTFVMAAILRQTLSWELVLIAVLFLAAIGGLVFEFSAQVLLASFVEFYLDYLRQVDVGISVTADQAQTLLLSVYTMGQAYTMIVLLILARWCQSMLYNPGGFQKEFHQIRLTPMVSAGVVALILLSYAFAGTMERWLPILTVPLVISGIALVHWIIKNKEMSGGWLTGFYASLVLLVQLMYPFLISLAVMDSWMNIRNRIQTIQKD